MLRASDDMQQCPRFVRGVTLLPHMGVQRFRYRKERTAEEVWLSRQRFKESLLRSSRVGEVRMDRIVPYNDPRDPRPPPGVAAPSCMDVDYKNPGLRWAPRDVNDRSCANMEQWLTLYGDYEIALSLVGLDSGSRDFEEARIYNPFITAGFTYVHMSFRKLVEFVNQLHPEDRFLCYLIPEDVPVHMYFDLDGDFARFPHLIGRDEDCLNEVIQAISEVFVNMFQRPMDLTGLVLLQATSTVKLSWHIHITSEAFTNVYHLQQFVLHVNRYVAAKENTLLYRNGHSLIDPVPYMSNQNFRLPYNRKPRKTALYPRSFHRLPDGHLELLGPAIDQHDASCMDVSALLLWQCHPAFALPGGCYRWLELKLECKTLRKRKAEVTVQLESTGRNKRADHGTSSLTTEQAELVRRVVGADLGENVELYQVDCVKGASGQWCIRGTCRKQTAYCLYQTEMHGSPYVHSQNCMSFTLRPGTKQYRCFKCDTSMIGGESRTHEVSWLNMDEAEMRLFELPATVTCTVEQIVEPPVDAKSRGASVAAYMKSRAESATLRYYDVVLHEAACHEAATEREQALFESVSGVPNADRLLHKMITPSVRLSLAELDEHLDLLWKYTLEMRKQDRPPSWCNVLFVDVQFLDPVTQSHLRDFLTKYHCIAIRSPLGSGKTELILMELVAKALANPNLRILAISNAITYSRSFCDRADAFDKQYEAELGTKLGFRSYKHFKRPRLAGKVFSSKEEEKEARMKAAEVDRAMLQCPRLSCSLESLSRLLTVKNEAGESVLPEYDVILLDEVMQLHSIFHGDTMKAKRRMGLDLLTALCSRATDILAADGGLEDDVVLPFLHDLTLGKRTFAKVVNTRKTLTRRYLQYKYHGQWRMKLLSELRCGKRICVSCATSKEALAIRDDPDIQALSDLTMKVVHGKSNSEDRKEFVDKVTGWNQVQLFVYTPVISPGVDFNVEHFDAAFFFASDLSTMPSQAFQQLNRVRRLQESVVHVFLSLHPQQFRHLPQDAASIEEQLNGMIREHYEDVYELYHPGVRRQDLKLLTAAERASKGSAPTFVLDAGASPGGFVRRLFDTPGNRLYIRNLVMVNQGRAQYESILLDLIRSSGGTIEVVASGEEELKKVIEYEVKLRQRAKAAESACAGMVLAAQDLSDRTKQKVESRICRGEIEDGDFDALKKAEWKKTYGIALDDSTSLESVPDFASRFGTETRLQQVRNLKVMREEEAVVRATLTSEPVTYVNRDVEFRKHVQLVLDSIGFSTLWDPAPVSGDDLEATLVEGSGKRCDLVSRYEQCNLNYASWWKTWKDKHQCLVDERGELVKDGDVIQADQLVQAFVAGARQFLAGHLGVRLAVQRVRSGNKRVGKYHLDRTHWNEWSLALFHLPPQDTATVPAKRRRSCGE